LLFCYEFYFLRVFCPNGFLISLFHFALACKDEEMAKLQAPFLYQKVVLDRFFCAKMVFDMVFSLSILSFWQDVVSLSLLLEKPDLSRTEKEKAWSELKLILSGTINTIGDQSRIDSIRLSERIFLLPLTEYLNVFVSLTSAVQEKGFSYQVLFLDQEPQWIHS